MSKELKVTAIENGTVIDHIPSESTFKVVELLNLKKVESTITVATNLNTKNGTKGIVKIGDKSLTEDEFNKIAMVAPNATINIIKDYKVKEKKQVSIPDEIKNVVKCSNPKCITNNEKVSTKFYVVDRKPLKVKCHYCERNMAKTISLI